EFIASYDQQTARSQVLVMNGSVEVANILNKNLKYTVEAGTFTTVDPEKEGGHPRAPTRIGEASLNSAIAEFKSIPTKASELTPARAIASVQEITPAKKGEILFISSVKRAPASVAPAPKTVAKKYVQARDVPIRFYGFAYAEV